MDLTNIYWIGAIVQGILGVFFFGLGWFIKGYLHNKEMQDMKQILDDWQQEIKIKGEEMNETWENS